MSNKLENSVPETEAQLLDLVRKEGAMTTSMAFMANKHLRGRLLQQLDLLIDAPNFKKHMAPESELEILTAMAELETFLYERTFPALDAVGLREMDRSEAVVKEALDFLMAHD